MGRRQVRVAAIEKQLPAHMMQPEPQWREIEEVLVHERPIPVGVGSHVTVKQPLPHMPEVHGEKGSPDMFEMSSAEGITELEFEPAPDLPIPISVYVEESRNGDLMIRGFGTKVTTCPGNTTPATCILTGSARERHEFRITNEDPTNAIRIAPRQDLISQGWLLLANTTSEPIPVQTEVYAQSTAATPVQVSILSVYEQVFFTGSQPRSRKRHRRRMMAAALQEAERMTRRIEGIE